MNELMNSFKKRMERRKKVNISKNLDLNIRYLTQFSANKGENIKSWNAWHGEERGS